MLNLDCFITKVFNKTCGDLNIIKIQTLKTLY